MWAELQLITLCIAFLAICKEWVFENIHLSTAVCVKAYATQQQRSVTPDTQTLQSMVCSVGQVTQ